MDKEAQKVKPEDLIKPSQAYIDAVASVYQDFYEFRNQRQSGGHIRHLQQHSLEDFWKKSRELFWNSAITDSEDLKSLGLEFSLPFVRKEVMDFLGRLVSLNIVPFVGGEGLNQYGVKVLQAIYKKWRLKSKDRVEKFWEVLYGVVNGTVCSYIGFDGKDSEHRFLRDFDPATGEYRIETKTVKQYNDVFNEIWPLEEVYLAKIWERNIQKQGRVIRKQEMTKSEFDREFGSYPDAKYVQPGNRIAEDSLFFQLLGGTGITTSDKIQVFKHLNVEGDSLITVANGIWLNRLGQHEKMPMPFHHKMMPLKWSQLYQPIDEKFAYGMSLPFMEKDPHKLLNLSYTMLMEAELRAIDRPYLTHDIEDVDLQFGNKRTIRVGDIDAYKPIEVAEPSGQFFTMMNSLQGTMTSQAQGGFQQIAPSKQPRSAREVVAMENLKQLAMGSTLVMYFDLVYQEIMLVLKTALQFYQTSHYGEEDVVRSFALPNFPVSQGGMGRLEVRIVKKKKDSLALHFEAVDKSIKEGKITEIIEVPVELLNNLEFFIDDIKLEPEKSSDLERTLFYEQVVTPMLNFFVPMGLADPMKVMARYLEKIGEHPQSYVPDQILPQVLNSWGSSHFQPAQMGQMGMGRGQPGQQQTSNLLQTQTGMTFGGQSNGGQQGLAIPGAGGQLQQ
jgi:hypothetical protein